METRPMQNHMNVYHYDDTELLLPTMDGIESTVIATRDNGDGPVAVISESRILALLEAQFAEDGAENPRTDAEELYSYNIETAYYGVLTPIFVLEVDRSPWESKEKPTETLDLFGGSLIMR